MSALLNARFGVRVLNLLILYSLNGFFSLLTIFALIARLNIARKVRIWKLNVVSLLPFDRIHPSKALKNASSI